jgi:selenophosphate synthase
VPLRSLLYPALKRVKRKLCDTNIKIELGNDAYIFESNRKIGLKRRLYPLFSFKGRGRQKVREAIRKFKPASAIILASYINPASRNEIIDSLYGFYKAVSGGRTPFSIGKGHSLEISKIPGQKFILADYLISRKGNYYGAASNDAIVTVDFNLKHSSWLNIYISLNNALNDLYALGVYRDIMLYPVYDSIYENDNRLIKKSLASYLSKFKKYNYSLVDSGPLGLGLEIIGSTVVGFFEKEPPRISNLLPGQLLIVTRPIGDLAALVLYIIRQVNTELSADIRRVKLDVLGKMATPNIEAAKIISDYLPLKGSNFDRKRHITATKDISGEGISAFEDMAFRSKTNIHLDEIQLHTDESSGLNLPNNTSCTNGAIIIAADEKPARGIINRLEGAGYRPWIAGRAGLKSEKPVIFLKKSLKKHPFLKYRSRQLFSRYKFV